MHDACVNIYSCISMQQWLISFLPLRVSDAIVRLLQEQLQEPVVLDLALGARQVAERGGRHLRSSRGARR